MTADSSHKDGLGAKGSRRVSRGPAAATPSKRATPNLDAAEGAADADLEFDPTRPLDELVDFASMLPPLELYELEPTLPPPASSDSVDLPPTLAPETPLPRCLTDAVFAPSRPAPQASKIPP